MSEYRKLKDESSADHNMDLIVTGEPNRVFFKEIVLRKNPNISE